MNTERYDDGFPGNITCSGLNVGQNEAIHESLGGRWNRVQSCLRLPLLQHKHGNEYLMLGRLHKLMSCETGFLSQDQDVMYYHL